MIYVIFALNLSYRYSCHSCFTINNVSFSFAFPLTLTETSNARQIPLSRRNPAVKYSSHRVKRAIIRRALQYEVSRIRKNFRAFSAPGPNILGAFRRFCKGCFFPSALLATPRCWHPRKSPEIRGLTFYRTAGLYCSDCGSTKREGIKSTAVAPEETSP